MGLRKIVLITSLFFSVFCFSCRGDKNTVPETHRRNFEEEKIAVNREIIRREKADAELIAKRYDWNLTRTQSGLYYQITHNTTAKQAESKDRVKIKGTISLSDGREVYNSENDGIKEFIIDQSDEPVGMHELMKLMREGEKANAILPSHLAYGVSGDAMMRVPSAALLICKLELIKIN